MMDPREYYLQQSAITDPGEHAPLLDDLPSDIGGLCSMVRGLVVHHLRGERPSAISVSEERRQELDTCFVSDMLERIVELDHRPLTEPRPAERRLAGCCRDFAVLLCATGRHKGIPACVRFGFTACRKDGFVYHQVVTQCWDASERRWVLVDPEVVDGELAGLLEIYEAHPGLRAPDLDHGGGPKRSLPELSPGLLGRSRSARLVFQPRLP